MNINPCRKNFFLAIFEEHTNAWVLKFFYNDTASQTSFLPWNSHFGLMKTFFWHLKTLSESSYKAESTFQNKGTNG